jgi:hypothetical protein
MNVGCERTRCVGMHINGFSRSEFARRIENGPRAIVRNGL